MLNYKTLRIIHALVDLSLEETIRSLEFLKHQLSLDLRYRMRDLPASPDMEIQIETLEQEREDFTKALEEIETFINAS